MQFTAHSLPESTNAIYIVFADKDVIVEGYCTDFCGEHGNFAGPSGGILKWVIIVDPTTQVKYFHNLRAAIRGCNSWKAASTWCCTERTSLMKQSSTPVKGGFTGFPLLLEQCMQFWRLRFGSRTKVVSTRHPLVATDEGHCFCWCCNPNST